MNKLNFYLRSMHTKNLSIFLLTLFIFSVNAFAQDRPHLCRSPYALMSENFNYKAYKSGLDGISSYSVVTLWNSFGTKTSNYAAELADPRVTGTELVLFNETCVTNANCGSYEVLAGYNTRSLAKSINSEDATLKNKVLASAQKAQEFLAKNLRQDQFCLINPLLETHQNRKTWSQLVAWLEPVFKGRCQFVWNPTGVSPGEAPPKAAFVEAHGDSPVFNGASCIANPDGTVISSSEYPNYINKYAAQCQHVCLWGLNDNCNFPASPKIDPRQRTCEYVSDFAAFNPIMKSVQ